MPSCPYRVRGLAAAFLGSLLGAAPLAVAQCTTHWLPGQPLRGIYGSVNAVEMWDPDGTGPAQPLLVVAGSFSVAGDLTTNHIATFDPATGVWAPLGSGLPAVGRALAVLANGDLVAATSSTTLGVVRWDGNSWSAITPALDNFVWDLLALPNGDLIAAGAFTTIGGVATNRIARWNGSSWSSLGGGFTTMPFGLVRSVVMMPNGDLVAASFSLLFGYELARWNGTAWSMIATAASASVTNLATMPNGDLVAAGFFTTIGGVAANSIARWDGVTWSPLGAGIAGQPLQIPLPLLALPNGELLVGAYNMTSAGGIPVANAARWDGTSWSPLGTGVYGPIADWARLPNGDVVAGGNLSAAGGMFVRGIARWDGSAWSPLTIGADTNDSVDCVAALPGGGVVVGGRFTMIGGVAANRVAIRAGGTFTPLGAGTNGNVSAVAAAPNGDVIVGGSFTSAGGVPVSNIALWDGSAWSPLGSGMAISVDALTFAPNGDLVVGSNSPGAGISNYIARWNGSAWTTYGPGLGSPVRAVAALPNGNIAACLANGVMLWNGAAWTSLGVVNQYDPGDARAMLALPDGGLLLGGSFVRVGPTYARNIARWHGGTWSPMSALHSGSFGGWVSALARLPDGDLVAAGSFTTAGSVPATNVARWNGTWSAMDGGITGGTTGVTGLAFSTTGLVASGTATAGTSVSMGVAELASTCPATSTGFGSGCPSSGGGNTLRASMPWVESTLATTGTGLPATALIVAITSVTAIPQGLVPLAGVFVEGIPGCDVLVAPDILTLLATTTGTATLQTPLPDTPPLVGVTFYQQMVPLDLDTSGTVVAITATNAVQLIAGRF